MYGKSEDRFLNKMSDTFGSDEAIAYGDWRGCGRGRLSPHVYTKLARIQVFHHCNCTTPCKAWCAPHICIPNTWRNDRTFAYAILTMKFQTEYVLFTKDSSRLTADQNGRCINSAQRTVFSCCGKQRHSVFPTAYFKIPTKRYKTRHDQRQTDPKEYDPHRLSFPQFLRRTKINEPSRHVPYNQCYGGIFAIKTSILDNIPIKIFENINALLKRGDNIIEGHFMERTWQYLFEIRNFLCDVDEKKNRCTHRLEDDSRRGSVQPCQTM